jgi:hypothetical protein
MSAQSSPYSAPEYSLHRDGVAAADVMANVIKKHGCNAYMYNYAHIQVVPKSGANPDVVVWGWSEAADAFVQEHTPIAKAGVGADTPYEFTIEPRGRIFFVQVAAIAAGNVDILVSGFERHQFS